MTSHKRWEKAQTYERDHWAKLAEEIARGKSDLEWYQWRAKKLEELIKQHVGSHDPGSTSVVEIGSGPVGIASCLKAERRCAIDPLMDFYNENPSLKTLRDPSVEYVNAGGEQIPYSDQSFSLAIIDNVIDHTESPIKVLSEIHRVLRKDGLLYFSVNVRTPWGFQVRRLMELFEVDPGHPHSYTAKSARALLADNRFGMLMEHIEDRASARAKERQEGDLNSRMKLLLGVYDILFETLARRSD